MRQHNDLDPLAQAEIEREIMKLSGVLTQITEEIAASSMEAATTDSSYKLAYARQQIKLAGESGTVSLKDAMALDACASEYEAMKVAEAVYRALQEAGRNKRSQLDALRTLAANVRSVVAHSTGQGG